MKKILIYLFCFLFVSQSIFTQSIYAQQWDMHPEVFMSAVQGIKDSKNDVIITYQGTELSRMTMADFQTMLKSTDFLDKLTQAEKNARVYIILADNPWKVTLGKKFESTMKIIWKDENNKILKTISVDMTLQTDPEGRAFLLYKDVSCVLFPVMSVVVLVLIVILLVR